MYSTFAYDKEKITMQLSPEVKNKIQHRDGMRIRNRLAFEMDKSYATIERWLSNDDEMLTTAAALKIISEETGIEKDRLLIESTVQK